MIKMNLRNKLLVIILPLTIIIIAAISIISYRIATKTIENQQKINMKNIVEKSMHELDFWINRCVINARDFAQSKAIISFLKGKGDSEEAKKEIERYNKLYKLFELIFIADKNGVIVKDSGQGKTVGIKLFDIYPYLKNNLTKIVEENIYISKAGKSPFTGEPGFLIAAPVVIDGKLMGFLGAPVSFIYFWDTFLSKVKIGKKGYLVLMNEKTLLAHPDNSLIFNIKLKDHDFGKKVLKKRIGFIEYIWQGKEKIGYVREYEKKKWFILTTEVKDDFLSSSRQIKKVSFILGITGIFFIFTVIWVFIGNVFKIINKAISDLQSIIGSLINASREIASSSHMLAEGASEQAAALEETCSSLEQMSSMTKTNAENANKANGIVKKSFDDIKIAEKNMNRVTASMTDISSASNKTRKIVNTIDEISFQTNLLALNAAVEAARAGKAGAGFAVVAEEVRNLAIRAAEAAKNTANLIEETIKKVNDGTKLVEKTNEAFVIVSKSATKVGELVEEIAAASSEQAQGITQVNNSINEMDKVVQQNAANAEESASSAEEMRIHAEKLENIITRLMVLKKGSAGKDDDIELEREPQVTPPSFKKVYADTKTLEKKDSYPLKKEIKPDELIPLDENDFKDF